MQYIDAAVEYSDGKWTLQAVLERIARGEAQLWQGEHCAGVTWFEYYPGKMCLVLAFAGGDMGELLELLPTVEAFAHRENCQQIDVYGRGGWERVLKSSGYRKTSTICSKELSS